MWEENRALKFLPVKIKIVNFTKKNFPIYQYILFDLTLDKISNSHLYMND